MNNRNKTAVVTGSPGWLGDQLTSRLLDNGWRVTLLVQPEAKTRLAPFIKKKARIIFGDVTNAQSLTQLFHRPVSVVFHCVGIIHPKRTVDFFRINRDGTKHMLEATKQQSSRFVYISSNAAAGFSDHLGRAMTEDDQPHPESPYGKSKLQAEQLVQAAQTADFKTVILRPSMYIGSHQPKRMTSLMNLIARGRVPLFAGGQNQRSFTVINNLIDAMLLVAIHPKASGELFWIVSEHTYTTREFLELIAHELEVNLKTIPLPNFPAQLAEKLDQIASQLGFYQETLHILGETTRSIAASGKKAQQLLGYQPQLSVAQGLREAVNWAQSKKLL